MELSCLGAVARRAEVLGAGWVFSIENDYPVIRRRSLRGVGVDPQGVRGPPRGGVYRGEGEGVTPPLPPKYPPMGGALGPPKRAILGGTPQKPPKRGFWGGTPKNARFGGILEAMPVTCYLVTPPFLTKICL